jgi:hypothetical protein
MKQPISGMTFEKVNPKPDLIAVGDQLNLIGYGCTTDAGEKTSGKLFAGLATVTELPTSDLYTKTEGGAAICSGDSGGGAFTQGEGRVLVGVVSAGDLNEQSWLATTGGPGFVDWATKWSGDHKVKICGLHSFLGGCRGD